MLSKQRRAELEKMGQAPLVNTQWTDRKVDKAAANLYFRELRQKMRYDTYKKVPATEFAESKSAAPNAKQEASASNKVFPSNALYRYLLRPIRETFIELFSGKRVTTNLLKLLGGTIFIAAVVAAIVFFPPIAPFFTFAALASPAGIAAAIGVIAPLALGGIALLNSVISGIEKFARKRHWDRYENFRSTAKRWEKGYGVSEDTLSNMNAYLFNKLKNSKNKQMKKMFTKLIDKKLDLGHKAGAHAVGVFFAKELEMLVQAKQDRIAEISQQPSSDPFQDSTLIALQNDLNIVAKIVEELKDSTLPDQTIESLSPAYTAYEAVENKATWKQVVKPQIEILIALLQDDSGLEGDAGVDAYKQVFKALEESPVMNNEQDQQEIKGYVEVLSQFKMKRPKLQEIQDLDLDTVPKVVSPKVRM